MGEYFLLKQNSPFSQIGSGLGTMLGMEYQKAYKVNKEDNKGQGFSTSLPAKDTVMIHCSYMYKLSWASDQSTI